MSKRTLALITAAALAAAGTSAWMLVDRGSDLQVVSALDPAVAAAEAARHVTGSTTKAVTLTAAPATVQLGGRAVRTWAFNGAVPGPEIRLAAGDTLKATVENRLPEPLTMHWHGIRLRNDMDGVPGVTQEVIAPGSSFTYTFTVPDSGTYWYHPHTGVQLDTGLYGPLVVTSRVAPTVRDLPLVLDDWTDGWGETPQQVLAQLRGAGASAGGGMGHDMGSMGGMSGGGHMGGEDTGDVQYPAYLVNGRTPDAPPVYPLAPGERVRLRLVNAGADTTFRVAVGGSRLTVVATDGFPVEPVTVDTLRIAMGERYDVELTAPARGALPVVAVADGKSGQALAVLQVGSAPLPRPDVAPRELSGVPLQLSDLHATAAEALPVKRVDRSYRVQLTGSMAGYAWGIRVPRVDGVPMPVRAGERIRLVITNMTMMAHPIHLHGHTFAVDTGRGSGPRKDTVLVPSMGTVAVELDADNPGEWMLHCHNTYHAEAGMMTQLTYVR